MVAWLPCKQIPWNPKKGGSFPPSRRFLYKLGRYSVYGLSPSKVGVVPYHWDVLPFTVSGVFWSVLLLWCVRRSTLSHLSVVHLSPAQQNLLKKNGSFLKHQVFVCPHKDMNLWGAVAQLLDPFPQEVFPASAPPSVGVGGDGSSEAQRPHVPSPEFRDSDFVLVHFAKGCSDFLGFPYQTTKSSSPFSRVTFGVGPFWRQMTSVHWNLAHPLRKWLQAS